MAGGLVDRMLSWSDANLATLGHWFIREWSKVERSYRRPFFEDRVPPEVHVLPVARDRRDRLAGLGAGIMRPKAITPSRWILPTSPRGSLGEPSAVSTNLANNPQWQDLSTETADKYRLGTSTNRDAQFARANALGSTAYGQQKALDNQAYGRSLAGLAGTIYGQERTNQERAATIAPDWTRSYQQVPYRNLSAYKGLLSGWGGSQSQPYYTNPYAGILGGMSAVGSLFGKNGVF